MPLKEEKDIRNFAELVLRHGTSVPSRTALVTSILRQEGLPERESVTFGELTDRICLLAGQLRGAGFKPGDRIAVAMGVSVQLYALVLAIMMTGAVPVLINPGSGLMNAYHSLKVVRLSGIISGRPIGKWRYLLPVMWRIRKLMTLEALEGILPDPGVASVPAQVEEPLPNQAALITFTSGSSGRPKGVHRSHEILISQYEALREHFPPLPGQIDFPAFPVVALYDLCCGVTAIMPMLDLKAVSEVDPAAILEQIRQYQVNTLSGAPAYLKKITDYCLEHRITIPEIKGIAVGGAPVSGSLASQIQQVFPEAAAHILYGSSEAEPITSVPVAEYLAVGHLMRQGYLVGKKAASVQLKILPLDEAPNVPEHDPAAGITGEILVAGKHVCLQYFRNPEADKKYKLTDRSGTTWHRTGDIGFLDESGRLWLTGRLENLFQIGNRTIYPFQVERIVECLPGVGRAAVVSDPGNRGILVFIEGAGSGQFPEAAIRSAIAQQLGPVPVRLQMADRLPVDMRHQSKLDYPRLRRMVRRG